MKISLGERLRSLLFGATRLVPHLATDIMYGTGRLYVRLQWTTYRRWRGVLLPGFEKREGLMEVSIHFNPGLPAELFEAFLELSSDTGGPGMTFIPASCLETSGGIEDVMNGLEQHKWACSTVVRSGDDLMVVHDWFDQLSQLLSDQPELFGGYFDDGERGMARDLLGRLTERLCTCQLNT
jgi:hypothetical protein